MISDKVTVKINLYKGCWVEDVIYFRYKLPLAVCQRWLWYFEYLVARVKVKNPRRKVELIIVSADIPCGQDYISEHAKNFLKAKKIKLKKLRSGRYDYDLFGFAKASRSEKEQSLMEEIAALERGEFNYYIPVTYKNSIKFWI